MYDVRKNPADVALVDLLMLELCDLSGFSDITHYVSYVHKHLDLFTQSKHKTTADISVLSATLPVLNTILLIQQDKSHDDTVDEPIAQVC
jgi:hypothetical protein